MSTRILVVDDHGTLRKSIADYLRKEADFEEVLEAANGVEALSILQQTRVDVVITDLVMPLMDGYMLMEELKHLRGLPTPQTIVISALSREDFIHRAIDMGAMFYLVKPFEPSHLLEHIRQLTTKDYTTKLDANTETITHTQSLDERVGSLLLTIGIPAHIKGYQYLRCGIKMVVDRPDIINRITKELYPSIARQYSTTSSKVERAIRHAIEVAWNRGRVDTINRAFGCRVCTQDERPTNGEFIAMIADKMSMERSA